MIGINLIQLIQVKLENELQQIEEKHRTKKMRFSESSEQFYADLNKVIIVIEVHNL